MLDVLGPYTGHAAGLATSLLWTATSLFFTAAARRIGPVALNAFRLTCAVALLGVTHRLVQGYWVPETVPRQVVFLAFSGLVGLTIGDQVLFIAFLDIGPRLSMLIMTTAPLTAALLGWIALGERLGGWALIGITLTVAGVAWVVLERPARTPRAHQPHRVRGIVMALIAAACQAGGLMLSKVGMGHGWLDEARRLDPQAATLVRMVFAALAMTPLLAYRHARRTRKLAVVVTPTPSAESPETAPSEAERAPGHPDEAERASGSSGAVGRASGPSDELDRASGPSDEVDRASGFSDAVERASLPAVALQTPAGRWASGLGFAACGSVVGPFLGVWMSLVASDRVQLGVAQTLCSLSPVFILPFAAKLHGERIGPRAILGALIAVTGVAALMMKTD